jgi:membrane protease YdiL (CAAX protease family)
VILDDPQISSDAVRVGIALAASGIALGPLASSMIAWFADERPRFFARWGFSHALLVLLAGLAAVPLAGLAVGALVPDAAASALAGVLATVLVMGAVAAAAVAIARRLSPEGFGALGFPGVTEFPLWRGLVAALLGYLCVLPAVVGFQQVAPAILTALGVEPPANDLVAGVLKLSGASLAVTVALCVLVGPFLEELVFRGFLQPLLIQNFSEKGGIVLTAALFAALHGVYAFAPLFTLALLLGVLKVRTQRLAAPLLVHVLHNALVLFVALRFSDPVPGA